jgi:hypothetical protein
MGVCFHSILWGILVFDLGAHKQFTKVRASQRLSNLRPTFGVFFWGNHYNTTLSILGFPNVCALENSILCCLLLGCPFLARDGGRGREL